jgi:hypothetical protein
VAIDVDRLTVEAIAGKIRNVVLAIKPHFGESFAAN